MFSEFSSRLLCCRHGDVLITQNVIRVTTTAHGQCYGATWSPNKLSFHSILSETPFFSWRLDSVRGGCQESNKSMLFRLNLKNKWSASGKLKSYQTSFEVLFLPILCSLNFPPDITRKKPPKTSSIKEISESLTSAAAAAADSHFIRGKFKGYRETGSNFLLNLIFLLEESVRDMEAMQKLRKPKKLYISPQ